MRDWNEVDKAYAQLFQTVYPQPEDEGHLRDSERAIGWFLNKTGRIGGVIDLGCGTGFAQEMFGKHGVSSYYGVSWGKDVEIAQSLGRTVEQADFNFLPDDGRKWDAGYSRHSLEHSPFPHITLINWRRIVNKWLMIVLPAYEWFRAGIKSTNHFSVLDENQWRAVFTHADLKVEEFDVQYHEGSPVRYAPDIKTPYEYWFLVRLIGG